MATSIARASGVIGGRGVVLVDSADITSGASV